MFLTVTGIDLDVLFSPGREKNRPAAAGQMGEAAPRQLPDA
jgi:hypothetical protein